MLAGLLVAILMFFSGNETVMLNPEMGKSIKKTVQDKERKQQIDQVLKEIKQDQKLFIKETQKPSLKELENLNLDYNSSRESFESLLNTYYTELEELQNKYLDNELKIRSLTKEDEWTRIMDLAVQKPDKEKDMNEIRKQADHMHANLQKAVESNITDTASLDKARLLLDEYESRSVKIAEQLLHTTYNQHEAIRSYDASRSGFESLRSEILATRKEYMSFVVDMRFQLKDLTPEANWKNVAKAINKNLEKAG